MTSTRMELSLALERFPLKSWLTNSFGVIHEGGAENMIDCPRCVRQKLSVNVEKRRWRCFICEKYRVVGGRREPVEGAGTLWGLFEWLWPTASKKAIADFIIREATSAMGYGDVTQITTIIDNRPPDDGTRSPCGLPDHAGPIQPAAYEYLNRRGITWEDVETFQLRYVPHGSGWLSHRIVFPVVMQGACVYWQARACWDEKEHVPKDEHDRFRKTLNPAARKCPWHGKYEAPWTRCPTCSTPMNAGSGDVLLNIEVASRYPRVSLCEGPTSAIRMGPSAVATFGKQLQDAQIRLLIAYGVKAVDFRWDGPSEKEPYGAWREAIVAAHRLTEWIPDVRICFYPSGDPGNYARADNFRMEPLPFRIEMLGWYPSD